MIWKVRFLPVSPARRLKAVLSKMSNDEWKELPQSVPIQEYEVDAPTRVQANLMGWRKFNHYCPLFRDGVRVETYVYVRTRLSPSVDCS